MEFRTPYLIQRASIRKNAADDAVLSKAVNLDYMGSSEFEFGALPQALKDLAARSRVSPDRLEVREIPGVNDRDGRPLLVIGLLDEEIGAYAEQLIPVVRGEARTKESTGFEDLVTPMDKLPSYHQLRREPPAGHKRGEKREKWLQDRDDRLTKFFWDIRQGPMMSFEPDFMQRLPGHLCASWTTMELELPELPAAAPAFR